MAVPASHAMVRDHMSGDDFIMVGSFRSPDPDMYVSWSDDGGVRPVSAVDLDFIAGARQDIPALVAEVRRLRDLVGNGGD